MKKITWVILAILTFSVSLSAQSSSGSTSKKNREAVELYENYALKPYSDFWSGGYTRNADGRKFPIGQYSPDNELLFLLLSSPSAKPYAEKYSSERTTGDLLSFGGLGLAFSGVIFATLMPEYTITNMAISLGLVLGGMTLTIIGNHMTTSAFDNLSKAVWRYNRDLIAGRVEVSRMLPETTGANQAQSSATGHEPQFQLAFSTRF